MACGGGCDELCGQAFRCTSPNPCTECGTPGVPAGLLLCKECRQTRTREPLHIEPVT